MNDNLQWLGEWPKADDSKYLLGPGELFCRTKAKGRLCATEKAFSCMKALKLHAGRHDMVKFKPPGQGDTSIRSADDVAVCYAISTFSTIFRMLPSPPSSSFKMIQYSNNPRTCYFGVKPPSLPTSPTSSVQDRRRDRTGQLLESGKLHYSLGELGKAAACFERAIGLTPSSSGVLDRAAEIPTPFPPSKNRTRPGDWTCHSLVFHALIDLSLPPPHRG
ncbi:Uu.00g050300.m01.CDS01, partial [Anthostomella pinea]